MDKDTLREFNKVFEEKYICNRVKEVSYALENECYGRALDLLSMIQDKANAAICFIERNK